MVPLLIQGLIGSAIGDKLKELGESLFETAADKGINKLQEVIKDATGLDIDINKKPTKVQLEKLNEHADEIMDSLESLKERNRNEEKMLELEIEEMKEENDHIYKIESEHTSRRALAVNMYANGGQEITNYIIKKVMDWNLIYIFLLLIINVVILGVAKVYNIDSTILITVGNILGVAIGNLFNERQAAINFSLGSSIGSKIKTKLT